ncbi:MAG: hypothetical protein ACRDDY_18715 [Clostridium sp.]|uniref:hypothetical protein n=1 Tax=Clostridium sp. TaxID=1506 RepID=UPI003EE7C527
MKLQFDEDCLYLLKQYSIRKRRKYDLVLSSDMKREFSISNKRLNRSMCNKRLNFCDEELEKNDVYSLKTLANYMRIDYKKFINKIVDGKYIKPQGTSPKKNVYYYAVKEIINENGDTVKVQEVNEVTDAFSDCIFSAIVSCRKEVEGFNKNLSRVRGSLTLCSMLLVVNIWNVIPDKMSNIFKISMYSKNELLYFSLVILIVIIVILYKVSKKGYKK